MKTANYKKALNLATTEVRKSKRTLKKKLSGNIKNYSKSFYAYVRSKQKVRDKGRTTGKQQRKHNFRRVSNGRGPE